MEGDRAYGPERLPHADMLVGGWTSAWRETGRFVLLLDFDGTLAPIVDRPEEAALPAETRAALERLLRRRGLETAVISGRGLADARSRARLDGIWYAGNHGMEIEGPGVDRVHPEAAAARPVLESARDAIAAGLAAIEGALVEDKGLTLSIHHRLTPRGEVPSVRAVVERAVAGSGMLKMTAGKEVLEVRPRVDWHKGRAVEFLLDQIRPAAGVPVVYIGDDTTDEDAFRALREGARGEGIVVADPPPPATAAAGYVRDPAEVTALLDRLGRGAPE